MITVWCVAGLGHLVARSEDEYVELALQLASDVVALSNLRMGLRDLMANSPLCDGAKFCNGLESAYRNMWSRYCKGDVPFLKRMELLQQQQQPPQEQIVSEESAVEALEATKITISKGVSPEPIRANGFTGSLFPPVS